MEKYNNNIDGTIDIQEQMAKNKKSAKKKILWMAGIFSLAAAVIATGTLVLRKDLKINPLLAQNYEVHGVDVSHYQGTIDWAAVKEEGIEYAFIRLGLRGYESAKIVLDEYYETNMAGANSAGVAAGVYFFTQAVTVEEAKEEADFVIEHLKGYDVSCPVVFDVERISGGKGRADQLTKEERTDITIAFCEAVRAAGYTPMIYGNVVCFTRLLDMAKLNDYEKWYAFYDDYMYMPYNVSCWQYTEKGLVEGIPGNVDLNISFKTW